MKENKYKRAEELAKGYWAATLTPPQEEELRSTLNSLPDQALSEELLALKTMLTGFSLLASENESQSLAPKAKLKRQRVLRLVSTLTAAAAVIALALVIRFDEVLTPEPEVYCYINGEPITDIEIAMEQTKYFKSLGSMEESLNILKSIKTY